MKSERLSFISNEAGLPMQTKNTQKVENELNRWKKEDSKRACRKFSGMAYWKQASTCTAL